MSRKLIQIRQHERVLQLTWIINNICTNHCDYCPSILHRGTNHGYDWENAKKFIDRLLSRHRKIHCAISGGEPTVSPFFPEMVDMFYNNGHCVGITTNGVRPQSYWDEIAPKLSYISFSYHPAYPDSDLLSKALATANHTAVNIRVMMDSRYWERAVEFYNECAKTTTISAEAVRIQEEMSQTTGVGEQYTEEQIRWLETTPPILNKTNPHRQNNPKHRGADNRSQFYYDDGSMVERGDANKLITTQQNDFRGWSCNIGLESLYVSFDGWVKPANCRQGDVLFHIDDHENHQLPVRAELCLQSTCFCTTDINISKVSVVDKNHPFIQENTNSTVGLSEEYDKYYGKSIKIKPI